MSEQRPPLLTLAQELPLLRASVDTMTRRLRHSRVVLVALVVVLLLVVLVGWQAHSSLACVQSWADTTAQRSAILVGPAQVRQQTFDMFLIDVAHNADASVLASALNRAVQAAQHYEALLLKYPPPPPPSEHCHFP